MSRVLAQLATLVLLSASTSIAAADDAPAARRPSIASELALSAGATAMLAPAIYSGARLVGTSTGDLNTSALPALLMATALPPAVAAGVVAMERGRVHAEPRFVRAYLFSLGAQLLVMTAAVFAKTWVAEPRDLLILSVATGAACGGAATLGAELSF